MSNFTHSEGDRAQFGMEFDDLFQAHRIDALIGAHELQDSGPQRISLKLQVTNQYFESRYKLICVSGVEELLEVMIGQFRLLRVARVAERDYLSVRGSYLVLPRIVYYVNFWQWGKFRMAGRRSGAAGST